MATRMVRDLMYLDDAGAPATASDPGTGAFPIVNELPYGGVLLVTSATDSKLIGPARVVRVNQTLV